MWPLLEKLGQLKNSNPALNGGKNASAYKKIDVTNEKVLAFERSKDNHKVVFLGNFSSEETQVKNPSINATDYSTGAIKSEEFLSLNPWEFKILIHN